MYEYKILAVDAGRERASTYKITDVTGTIDAGLRIHEEKNSWDHPPLSSGNPLFMGLGPFTGGPLFGTHRLVFVFRSPITGGIHVSTMGGAAYVFMRTGLDGLVIEGYSREPAIIWVVAGESGLEVDFDYMDQDKLIDVYKRGARGLHSYINSKMTNEYRRRYKPRIILVGPAALTTPFSGIFSWIPNVNGEPGDVVDSASRGGAGSVMAQGHGVVAVVFGGVKYRRVADKRRILNVASRVLGGDFYRVLEAATTKYRYDPKLGTGGTFGVNYVHYRELMPALAFNTIYYSPAVRLALHEKIMNLFWKPFQDKVFGSRKDKPWKTCGEPCSAVCKKVWNGVKLDYEPAHGLGPMIGVITLEDTASLVEYVDDLGLDAIEAGHIISWLYDAIEKGLLEPSDLGVEERPTLDPITLDSRASKLNAHLARILLDKIASGKGDIPLLISSKGAREAARIMDEIYENRVRKANWSFRDLLVYASYGSKGYMTPNYYWSPGMIAPLYVLGRYWTDYSPSYTSPEEYAVHSYKRAIVELTIDNAGICRFHRKWAEKVVQALYTEILGLPDIDAIEKSRKIYRRIAHYQLKAGAEPRPWESRKTMDIITTIAAELEAPGWRDILGNYDKVLSWWHRFYDKLRELTM